jgi:hypothetical protein
MPKLLKAQEAAVAATFLGKNRDCQPIVNNSYFPLSTTWRMTASMPGTTFTRFKAIAG